MKEHNEPRLRETKPKVHLNEHNSKGVRNIFVKKQIRQRSISYSPDSSFDNFGPGQREKDEKKAHSKQEAYSKMLQIDSFRKNITDHSIF
jgi:hypothetical protein